MARALEPRKVEGGAVRRWARQAAELVWRLRYAVLVATIAWCVAIESVDAGLAQYWLLILGTLLPTLVPGILCLAAQYSDRGERANGKNGLSFATVVNNLVATGLPAVLLVFTLVAITVLASAHSEVVAEISRRADGLELSGVSAQLSQVTEGGESLLMGQLYLYASMSVVLWFAGPLVACASVAPWMALKQAGIGFLRNKFTMAIVHISYVMGTLVICQMTPVALVPWLMFVGCVMYVGYRDIYLATACNCEKSLKVGVPVA